MRCTIRKTHTTTNEAGGCTPKIFESPGDLNNMPLNPRILAELDRQAALKKQTRSQVQENILWPALFPNEPSPEEQARQAKLAQLEAASIAWQAEQARKVAKEVARKARVERRAWLGMASLIKQLEKAPVKTKRAKKDVNARWQAKIAEAKANWWAKKVIR